MVVVIRCISVWWFYQIPFTRPVAVNLNGGLTGVAERLQYLGHVLTSAVTIQTERLGVNNLHPRREVSRSRG